MKLIKGIGIILVALALAAIAFVAARADSERVQANSSQAAAPEASASPAPFALVPDLAPTANLPDNKSVMAIEKRNPWDQIVFNTRKLSNNVWGAHQDEKLTSGIYLGDRDIFGWFWDRKNPAAKPGIGFLQPIYPGVRVGGNPWEKSNSPLFPIRVRDVNTFILEVSYKYPQLPTGNYNLAYDIFLTDTDQPSTKPKILAEVMVWLDGSARQPADSYKGEFTDGYSRFDEYSWTMPDGRQYYSFVIKEKSQNRILHSVDMKSILGKLDFNPDWYIPGIELGSEVWQGAGKIEIASLNVYVNDNPPINPASRRDGQ